MKNILIKKFYLTIVRPNLSAIKLRIKSAYVTFQYYNFFRTKSSLYALRAKSKETVLKIGKEFTNKKILFAPIYSFPDRVNIYEGLLARVFHEHGAKVSILSCNKGLPLCSWNISANEKLTKILVRNVNEPAVISKAKCSLCKNKFDKIYGHHADTKLLGLSKYLSTNNLDNRIENIKKISLSENKYYYKKINVFEHSKASALRCLLVGSLDLNNHDHVHLLQRFLVSSLQYIDAMEALFKEEKPDLIFCSHGIYLEHGILVDLCKKHNIRIVISGVPFKKDCLWFSVGDTYLRTIVNDQDYSWQEKELTTLQKQEVLKYIASKVSGGRDNVSFHPNPKTDQDLILSELGLKEDDTIISVFTNTLWDAQIVFKGNAFRDMMHWISETIKLAKELPDIKFVIRVHPAEVKLGLSTNQPIIGEIKKIFTALPKNLILVEPSSNISSVDLGLLSKCCLVYASKIGIELAVNGKLVVVAGEAICRNKGFTLDVISPEHYRETILNLDNVLTKFNFSKSYNLAVKWSYHLFFEIMINFPWASAEVYWGGDAKGKMPETEKESKELLTIARSILKDEKITQKNIY